jgi:hypothetical protein
MPRYRLDEYRFLRGKLTRNLQVWIEEIEFQEDGSKFFTEKYRQVSLIKLLKLLH